MQKPSFNFESSGFKVNADKVTFFAYILKCEAICAIMIHEGKHC